MWFVFVNFTKLPIKKREQYGASLKAFYSPQKVQNAIYSPFLNSGRTVTFKGVRPADT